ncbi:hypothetical protein IGI04_019384 [Brassica rapa subsp. trilocularis]|uniref:Uncharacterized protein n=1 Tax=Brassica rapa subsp. trilocularis TaxID=1813537 RepID=A0ABQ7MI25_BRACM|nr:hypothetical protein IGI04_019384 [Brassica rapa subsp. trilocularis]
MEEFNLMKPTSRRLYKSDNSSQARDSLLHGLETRIDGLQTQVIDLHKARETTENPELSSEVQSLKEKLGEHSKQLELSAEKLNQLQTENTALRDQNKAPNTASNKKRHFRPIGSLSTLNTGEGTTNATPASGAAGAT